MSILPILFDGFDLRPSRILDQHFGLGLDTADLFSPLVESRLTRRNPAGYYRPWRSQAGSAETGSIITHDKDRFQVNLDVQHFKPDEIKVTASGDNAITIEGKHEEKQDEHGYISRHFIRKYVLPEGHDLNQVVSSLSSDGVLSISAPKKSIEGKEERAIPIQQTGQPSKPIENKGTGDK